MQRFEAFLKDISTCFLERDLALWLSRLRLPFSVITRDGPVTLPTEADVARNFDLYLEAMRVMQLTLVTRHAVSLEDCRDGTWLGTFTTRLIRGDQLATAPYTSTGLLHLTEGDRFVMSSMLNGRGHSEWTGRHGA